MVDYLTASFDPNKPELILDYDFTLTKSINLNSLITRVNAGSKFNVIQQVTANVVTVDLKYPIKKLGKALKDLVELWNTQSLMYDFKTDPCLKLYGVVKEHNTKTKLFCLGLNTLLSVDKDVSVITVAKAMAAADVVLQESMFDSTGNSFNFNKFLADKNQ